MFLVSDTVSERQERIIKFLDKEPAIAVLLAAAHFEWVFRRAIIALGHSPNTTIRAELKSVYGLDNFKEIWKEEVSLHNKSIKILAFEIKDWSNFKKAFKLRDKLIHGVSTCTREYAEPQVKSILQAAQDVIEVCKRQNYDINTKLPIRRKSKNTYT
jgi:hypothetical protein